MFLRQRWTDKRLQHSEGTDHFTIMNPEVRWQPIHLAIQENLETVFSVFFEQNGGSDGIKVCVCLCILPCCWSHSSCGGAKILIDKCINQYFVVPVYFKEILFKQLLFKKRKAKDRYNQYSTPTRDKSVLVCK